MITKIDIKNLADLSRIEITPEEIDNFAPQIDSILDYVGQIKESTGDLTLVVPKLRNVMREDVVTNESLKYTEDILENAPKREGNYLKVKKILG